MSYSYTAAAGYTLDAIKTLIGSDTSNAMPDGGFWEAGRENADGAITGTVWKPHGADHVTRRGSFRINPDGTVARFPGLPKTTKTEAVKMGAAVYRRNHERGYDWRERSRSLAKFLRTEDGLAEHCWSELQLIAGNYQREKNVSFLALPAVESIAMAEFLESLSYDEFRDC